ncbi:hypothetical protein QBC38DRAFT_81903 [Podospora fimiseda]|uniref:C2H2-type domain-containing protein n=1 Tax=Podospora fimiseda TaxID=252190 RepID=A0AAN6YTG3_9PEZI|nr:hypothetical protein QBC38DRAFT_81903 [Podospora fimiseda]
MMLSNWVSRANPLPGLSRNSVLPWNSGYVDSGSLCPMLSISPESAALPPVVSSSNNSSWIKLDNGKFKCNFNNCGRSFTRKADANRHYKLKHEVTGRDSFLCQWEGCERRLRGFSRKDKRDEHERKVHGEMDRAG